MLLPLVSAIAAFALPACAGPGLDALTRLMKDIRSETPASAGLRSPTPRLTTAKHLLREWVEAQLLSLPPRGDEGQLAGKLNADLLREGLFYPRRAEIPEGVPSDREFGFLAPVRSRRTEGLLLLQTGVGIPCGFDESAYLYRWSGTGWRRIWESEQNYYGDGRYKPQRIYAVAVSPAGASKGTFVLTLGSRPRCTSVWGELFSRVFRIGLELAPMPLLDRTESLNAGPEFPVRGKITGDEALWEFHTSSLDMHQHDRIAVRRFRLDVERVERVSPIALSPRNFTEEWAGSPWPEAAAWSETGGRASIEKWHGRLAAHKGVRWLLRPTKRCRAPDLWEVGMALQDESSRDDAADSHVYFLIRWRPPFRFEMAAVNARPTRGCTADDPEADESFTLFG